ncbi:hypothetical protein X770_04780 [Mesorhizobium sp. LSJC269B00]|nr:hypothetical protein X770_04780 [Mesorhizobium sp. LSJC269B00]
MACLLGMAGTKPAKLVAVWDVQIERDFVALVERLQPATTNGGINAWMEMRRGRIAGVAWNVLTEPGN